MCLDIVNQKAGDRRDKESGGEAGLLKIQKSTKKKKKSNSKPVMRKHTFKSLM